MVITAIRVTDTGIIRMGTPDHIRTTAITGAHRTLGTTGIAFTVTTAIITTGIGSKLGVGRRSTELAWRRFRASFLPMISHDSARPSQQALRHQNNHAHLNSALNFSGR